MKLIGLFLIAIITIVGCGSAGPAGTDGKDGTNGKDGTSTSTPGVEGPAGPKGATGSTGATGSQGSQGPQGSSGLTNKLQTLFVCDAQLQGTSLRVTYNAAIFTNGDVLAYGDVYGPSLSFHTEAEYSSSAVGNTLAPLYLRYDFVGAPTSGNWDMDLNRVTMIGTVNYTDTDLPAPGKNTWVGTSTDCIKYNY